MAAQRKYPDELRERAVMSANQAGRTPKSPCKVRVFACAADRSLTSAVGRCCCCHRCCQRRPGVGHLQMSQPGSREVTRLLGSDPAPGPESGRITGSTSRVCALLLPARLRSVAREGPAPHLSLPLPGLYRVRGGACRDPPVRRL